MDGCVQCLFSDADKMFGFLSCFCFSIRKFIRISALLKQLEVKIRSDGWSIPSGWGCLTITCHENVFAVRLEHTKAYCIDSQNKLNSSSSNITAFNQSKAHITYSSHQITEKTNNRYNTKLTGKRNWTHSMFLRWIENAIKCHETQKNLIQPLTYKCQHKDIFVFTIKFL